MEKGIRRVVERKTYTEETRNKKRRRERKKVLLKGEENKRKRRNVKGRQIKKEKEWR